MNAGTRRRRLALASALCAALARAATPVQTETDTELERLALAGDAAFERGELELSEAAFARGFELARRERVASQIPRFRRNLAVLELTRQHPAAALLELERAEQELPADDPEHDLFLVQLYGDLGRVYQHLGGRRRAAATFARALELARGLGDQAAEVNVGIRRALLLTTAGAHTEALAVLEELEAPAEAASPRLDRAWLASVTGGVLSTLGEKERAAAQFARAVALERAGQNANNLAAALASEGDALLELDPEEAARRFDQVEALAPSHALPIVLATVASGRGELARAGGEHREALELHRRAAALVESATLRLDSPVRQAEFARESRLLFERWMESALAAGDRAGEREALLASERLRRLESLDLGGGVGPGMGSAASPADDAPLRAALAPHEVALVYRFLGQRLLVFALARERLERLELPIEREDAAQEVELYRELLASGDPVAWRPAAARLYQRLVAPLPAWVRAPGRDWIVIADGALDALPFETLLAEPAGQPVVATRAVSMAPSLAWLARARRAGGAEGSAQRPPGRVASAPPTALLVAVSGEPSATAEPEVARRRALWGEERAALGPLPGVRAEAELVARFLPASTLHLIGSAVSETELAAAPFGALRVVHFATHALAPAEEPERAALWLGAAGGPARDGVFEAKEIAALALDGPLVVLSACETLGRPSKDGSRGLASAFLAAGARAVVATRWRLGDASGAELMRRFYERLGEGASVGEALRAAQLSLAADRRYGAPAAWAAAVVVGDPASRVGDVVVTPRAPYGRRALGAALLAVAFVGGLLASRSLARRGP